jgi:O-methyltransferase
MPDFVNPSMVTWKNDHSTPRDPYIELLKQTLTGAAYEESAWRLIDGFRTGRQDPIRMLRRWILKLFAKRGYLMVQAREYDPVKRDTGTDWPLFGYSMVGKQRLDQLEFAIRAIVSEKIPGDFLEAGVWRGGAAMFMKAVLNSLGETDRKIWLADSFEGLPKPRLAPDKKNRHHDLSRCDYLKVSVETVEANFRRFNLMDDNVRFLKGWFCDSLPKASTGPLALLRLDGDLYESTMDALKPLYQRVVPGGFVVIDDYLTWSGCREAVNEFRTSHQIEAPLHNIDGSGVFWRVPAREAGIRAA